MADPAGDRVVAVIPAYQAASSVATVLDGLRSALPGAGVVVVDDGSSDGTGAVAAAAGAQVVRHARNLGKGAALAAGVARAVEGGATYVLTLDADGQHPPHRAPALLAPLRAGEADIVIGARRRDAGPMPPSRRLSNRLSSALLSRAIGASVPDSQSGFRAFTANVARTVRPTGARYEYETEFLLESAAAGFRLAAVPVPTLYAGEASHFRSVADTARVARVFLRHWRSILFGPARR